MAVNLIKVRSFGNHFDANLAIALLRDHGITAVLKNSETVFVTGVEVSVMVEDYDFEKANTILKEMA